MHDTTDAINADPAARAFKSTPFYAALRRTLARRGMDVDALCDLRDAVARRLLAEYGAMFLAAESVRVPDACLFRNAAEVAEFQARAQPRAARSGGATSRVRAL